MKKLAIVGSGTNTRGQAPFDDPEFDIWVVNEAANSAWCKRWSACFQMHEPEIYTGHNTKDPHHWEWLQQKHGKPIYMQEVDPRVPDGVAYPLQAASDLVGFTYLSSTIAMACALAALQDYEHVEFYGIEMSASEYEAQRQGYNFWVGFLKGRLGAEHVKHNFSYQEQDIFRAPLYGYEGNYAFGVDFFAERARLLDGQWDAADKNARNIKRAIERAVEKNEHEKVRTLTNDFQAAMGQCGSYAGALAEAERYQTFGSRYADRGGFELAAARSQRDGEEKRVNLFIWMGKIEYVWNIWKQSDNPQARAQLLQFTDALGRVAEEVGAHLGMYQENIAYVMKYDDAVQAGGRVLLETVNVA